MANVIELLMKWREEGVKSGIADVRGAVGGLASSITAGVTASNLLETATRELLTGVRDLTIGFVEQNQQLSLTAERLGLTLPQYRALIETQRTTGQGTAGVEASLVRFTQAVEKHDPVLRALGVTTQDIFQAYLQATDILGRLDDKQLANTASAKLFGISLSGLMGMQRQQLGMLPLLLDHYTQVEEKQKDLRKSADEAAIGWAAMRRAWSEVGDTIGGSLVKFAGDFLKGTSPAGMFGIIGNPFRKGLTEAQQAAGIASQQITADFAKIKEELEKVFEKSEKAKKSVMSWEKGWMNQFGTAYPSPAQGPGGRPSDYYEDLTRGMTGEGMSKPEDFMKSMREMHSGLTLLADSAAQALQSSFSAAFQGIIFEGLTLQKALAGIFASIGRMLLDVLAQLAVGGILGWLGGIIPGPLGTIFSGVGDNMLGKHGAAAPRASVTNININALDDRSFADAYRSPFGGARRAGDTLAFGASMA